METTTLTGGFASPPIDAACAFRAIMEAMARPGTLHDLDGCTPPAPLAPATGAVILTLCDADTPIYLAGNADCPDVRDWIAFHTGAPLTGPEHCMFAFGTWGDLMPLNRFPAGCAEYPDRSSTLVAQSEKLCPEGATLTGPGIQTQAQLSVPDPHLLQANHAQYPLGVDFIFTCGTQIAALPRSTEVN